MQLVPKATYLAMIRNSVGTTMFRNNYAIIDGAEKDILVNGQISCAFFASFILHGFGLIETLHTRTAGTVKDLEASGWRLTDTPREGDVIIWEAAQQRSGVYPHIGFYIDERTAVSHWDKYCTPVTHGLLFENHEKIAAFYTHDFLA